MQSSLKIMGAGLALSTVLLSFAPASAEPKEDVAAATMA
jgi:hypothetical protein